MPPTAAAASEDAGTATHKTLSTRLTAAEYDALIDKAWRERTSAAELSRAALEQAYGLSRLAAADDVPEATAA